MVAQKYRWDFIGLSTDEKPTAETSPKVTDGSTYYCSDTSQLYVWCNDQWYEKTATGGGGGGDAPTVVQTTGTSTTDVMSQNAATSMIFADPATQTKIKIGAGTSTSEGNNGIEIGHNAAATGPSTTSVGYDSKAQTQGATSLGYGAASRGEGSLALGADSFAGNTNGTPGAVAVGRGAAAGPQGSVAVGAYSSSTTTGVMHIGTTQTSYGYNSSKYRLLSGLYDGQSAHDAMTVGQANALIDAINTALSTNIPHIGA